MKIKGLVDEDFINYKLPSMFIIMPHCSFKCDKENGCALCQNSALIHEPDIEIDINKLINRYRANPLTKSIVFGGLEPFDGADDLEIFLINFRHVSNDPVVIYTGYTESEVKQKFDWIYLYDNIIIKYGRFRPNQISHYDSILGATLVSDNQYAKEYNVCYKKESR